MTQCIGDLEMLNVNDSVYRGPGNGKCEWPSVSGPLKCQMWMTQCIGDMEMLNVNDSVYRGPGNFKCGWLSVSGTWKC